jgi:hypothetical protein
MIRNPGRLFDGCPPGTLQAYKLRVLEHFLLAPLGAAWDLSIGRAYSSAAGQAALYAMDPKRAARKAKGTSQHCLGEAVDVTPEGDIQECFLWCLEHLRPWQAILEYERGKPKLIHLSIPSDHPEIVSKRLLYLDPPGELPGHFETWMGRFPLELRA